MKPTVVRNTPAYAFLQQQPLTLIFTYKDFGVDDGLGMKEHSQIGNRAVILRVLASRVVLF
jgi:hypothetical protein